MVDKSSDGRAADTSELGFGSSVTAKNEMDDEGREEEAEKELSSLSLWCVTIRLCIRCCCPIPIRCITMAMSTHSAEHLPPLPSPLHSTLLLLILLQFDDTCRQETGGGSGRCGMHIYRARQKGSGQVW